MSQILVDSRGCGCGKTTQTIIPRIKRNLQQGIKSIIVVPSINLQKQYMRVLPMATLINGETAVDGVNQQLYDALTRDDDIIVITHQAFLMHTDIAKTYRINRDLVVDEAFNPYSFLQINLSDSQSNGYFQFQGVFDWMDPEVKTLTVEPNVTPQPYFEIKVNSSSTPTFMINNPYWAALSHANTKIWTTWACGNAFINNIGKTSQVILEVDPDLLEGWASVWVAAAAFEHTFMAQWLYKNNMNAKIVYEFEPHSVKMKMHVPQDTFKWSKTLRNLDDSLIKTFTTYVNTHKNDKVIYVKNNKESEVLVDGIKITHNAHGINDYQELTDYAHMSAINPNAILYNFYKHELDMDLNQIAMSFNGYNAYQLIMRTKLRQPNNNQWVNIFLMDTTMALAILDLFDPNEYQVIPEIPLMDTRKQERTHKKQVKQQMNIKAPKKMPLTKQERNKLAYEKKKANQLSDNSAKTT